MEIHRRSLRRTTFNRGASYEQNNWYEPYTYQARELTGISSCDVCMVGDSLTMYGLWNEFWPDLVVLNRGIGSDTSEGLVARIDTIAACSPKKVFIMIGTNDIATGVAREDTIANIQEIVELTAESLPNAEIYLQSVLPRTSKLTNDVEAMNSELQPMCEKLASQGINVEWIDLYPLYIDQSGAPASELFAQDGYHMSGMGYQTWKDFLSMYIY